MSPEEAATRARTALTRTSCPLVTRAHIVAFSPLSDDTACHSHPAWTIEEHLLLPSDTLVVNCLRVKTLSLPSSPRPSIVSPGCARTRHCGPRRADGALRGGGAVASRERRARVATTICCLVHADTYRDSVDLMRVAALLEQLPNVSRAALMMATPANRELLSGAGLLDATAADAGPNDLVVAVAARDKVAGGRALAEASHLLDGQAAVATSAREKAPPRSIAGAAAELTQANLAIISTPGPYATAEALKALKRGLHVFLFSDNVPVADEVELKRLAVK